MKKVLLIGTAVAAVGSIAIVATAYVRREELLDKWAEFAGSWNDDQPSE